MLDDMLKNLIITQHMKYTNYSCCRLVFIKIRRLNKASPVASTAEGKHIMVVTIVHSKVINISMTIHVKEYVELIMLHLHVTIYLDIISKSLF